jgi:hypothetical protein
VVFYYWGGWTDVLVVAVGYGMVLGGGVNLIIIRLRIDWNTDLSSLYSLIICYGIKRIF